MQQRRIRAMHALQEVTAATIIASGLAVAMFPSLAHAQQKFPTKPIRLVVAFSAGSRGTVDDYRPTFWCVLDRSVRVGGA